MPLEHPFAHESRVELNSVVFARTGRFTADNLNKAKNLCSRSIGEKMKVEERRYWAELQKSFPRLPHGLFLPAEKGGGWGG